VLGPLLRTRAAFGMTMARRADARRALDIVRAYALAPGYAATNMAMRRSMFAGAEDRGPGDARVGSATAWYARARRRRVADGTLGGCGHLAMGRPGAVRRGHPRDGAACAAGPRPVG
jgi:hypothetical protein